MTPPRASFDPRADAFDRRSAPGAADAGRIADAVIAQGAGPVLDLGAGSGALGAALAARCRAAERRYLALDLSLAMLARFRVRLGGDVAGRLVAADAARRWPLADATVGALFAARVVHLLDPDPLATEIRRVVTPGGVIVLGTVRRDPDSPRAALRRRLHELLAERGVAGRSARRGHDALAERLGGTVDGPRTVAAWTVRETVDEALAGWRRPGHLAGREVTAPVRQEVLAALADWAARRYDPSHPLDTAERFEITAVRLP